MVLKGCWRPDGRFRARACQLGGGYCMKIDPALRADVESDDESADSFVYDAFISYGSDDSRELARSLPRALVRLAKPWYKFRIQRIFLYEAELPASPDLPAAIERALAASRWLVLIASPAAAVSPWVNREVGWWLDDGRWDRLIVAATTPDTAWNEKAGDWAEGALIPPALRGALAAEPNFVDLIEAAGSPGRPLPVDKVAKIATPIRGKESISDLRHGNSPRQRSLVAGVAATDPRPAQTAPFVRIGGVPGPRLAAFVKPSCVVARAQRRR